MAQPFWQKATVQAAIIAGAISAISVLVAVWLPSHLDAPKLKEENDILRKSLDAKTAEVQHLETILVPFKTIALERFSGTDTEALAKLALRLEQITSGMEALNRYQMWARLRPDGKTQPDGDLVQHSPLIDLLAGSFTYHGKGLRFNSDAESEARFLKASEQFPDFPFGHLGAAQCLRMRGDPKWITYAERAAEIFRHTTSLKEHTPSHDECRAIVEAWLEEANPVTAVKK